MYPYHVPPKITSYKTFSPTSKPLHAINWFWKFLDISCSKHGQELFWSDIWQMPHSYGYAEWKLTRTWTHKSNASPGTDQGICGASSGHYCAVPATIISSSHTQTPWLQLSSIMYFISLPCCIHYFLSLEWLTMQPTLFFAILLWHSSKVTPWTFSLTFSLRPRQ